MTNEELAIKIQQGHEELYPALWENVVDFVKYKAFRRYAAAVDETGNVVEVDDLVQNGYFAMIRAVRLFKPESGNYITVLVYCLKTAFNEALGRMNKDPLRRAISLDAPLNEDPDSNTLLDIQADTENEYQFDDVEEKVWCEELRNALEKAASELPPRQREIIFRRYALNKTLKEIGDFAGLSKEYIRQTERGAFKAMRKKQYGLEKFLDDMTLFYSHVGVNYFNATHTSSVELITFKREDLAKLYRP